MMKEIDAKTNRCLREETHRLKEDIRHCDYCASSVQEHRQCYVETARESGERSKQCFI